MIRSAPSIKNNKSGRGIIIAIFKKQDKKNVKEEKDLQAERTADKLPLDDELLDAVSGGFEFPFNPSSYDKDPGNRLVGTSMIKNFGIDPPED